MSALSVPGTPTAVRVQRLIVLAAPQLVLLLVLLIAGVVAPNVLDPDNLKQVVIQASPIAVLALGAMVVLLTGGIDLSAGYGVAMVAVAMTAAMAPSLTDPGHGLAYGLVIAAVFGLGLGLTNGILVGVLRLPAFIATLATFTAVQGVTLLQAKSGELVVYDQELLRIGTGEYFGVPAPMLVAVAVMALMGFLLRCTRFGVRTYAIGSRQRDAAALSGVPLARHLVLVYLLAGALTAVAAVVLTGRAGIVAPNLGGISLLLDAIAAAVLGGTSILGGRGSVLGTVTGAITIALSTNVLRVSGADASTLDLWRGVIIGVALMFDAALRTLHRRLEAHQIWLADDPGASDGAKASAR